MGDLLKFVNRLSIFLLINMQAGTTQEIESRIMHGDNVRIEDAPFYAGLIDCGAVIISDIWVLTAAHCLQTPKLPNDKYVWVGGESFANSRKISYSKVIIFPKYGVIRGVPLNDIALIKLDTPLKFTNKVQPIKLPDASTIGTKLVVVGRGKDETGLATKVLKKLDLIRLTTRECISLIPKQYHPFIYSNLRLFESNNICAKRVDDKPSICNGDSGGPLVSGNTLVGLVSYIGRTDCHSTRLGFYTNVITYVPWIKQQTGL